jgi:hypothetical protein
MQSSVLHLCCSGGNLRSGYPRSDDDDVLASLYLLRTSFLDQCWLVEARGGVVLFIRVPMTSLGGVAQRGLNADRGLMGSHRMGEPSSGMVASMVGLVRLSLRSNFPENADG